MWLAGSAPEGERVLPPTVSMLDVERLRLLLLGRVESNRPWVCECFLVCNALDGSVNGDAVRTLFVSVFGFDRTGREKLCRLLELLFACWVKLA
jgi:hypothetical protein